ncbi:hypothetical protein HMPREF2806_07125 [Corynebacterium sp. HMSC076G08]|uniref:Uncharacterized protein n=1 Tax=Corynebacterium minutissimum TaxID=38301 RepID=A0ACC4UAK4_9CORY|nr:hypothetical protein WU87_07900 [Corynebacterium minutissimum]OFK68238.1 hypothetical protein HMPREF2806_07125 [Corynebacterium sp. HMSC076G08]OFN79905.1 hypothetical protein HMPREF2526_06445 [Corynebacterium sp. HMSC070E08]OFP36892.1 hypothetical protein HMPREF2990_04405 [Corynebacterium sp. HMSC071B10]OHF43071.1 hypothetical protein HMPREF2550_00025 [Corynebacterium sp. HMSC074A01]OHO51192.1 hypothetical protein HMPREF2635_01860 [Corynebacterium sp. HMSC035E02]
MLLDTTIGNLERAPPKVQLSALQFATTYSTTEQRYPTKQLSLHAEQSESTWGFYWEDLLAEP